MTLGYSMDKNKLIINPIIKECTSDAVACVMYDTLIESQFSSLWEQRGDFITDTFDWGWESIHIGKANTGVILPPVEERGLTKHDELMMEENEGELPSLHHEVDMKMWLQKTKKRMMEEVQSQPAGEQSFLSSNMYLNQG
jgi:hypothetical protein